jgi:hypothetical protein
MQEDLEALVAELRDTHGCHTIILYGSRARGDWTTESDYDVVGIRDRGPAFRDARPWRGSFLDAFIYPESAVTAASDERLHWLGGRVLTERGDLGRRLLAGLAAIEAAGPGPLAADDATTRRVWMRKMLDRVARGDLEGHYRRAWLQFQALEDYFALRGLWYRGPKEAFTWLATHDPETLQAFERALAPDASMDALKAKVERVAP